MLKVKRQQLHYLGFWEHGAKYYLPYNGKEIERNKQINGTCCFFIFIRLLCKNYKLKYREKLLQKNPGKALLAKLEVRIPISLSKCFQKHWDSLFIKMRMRVCTSRYNKVSLNSFPCKYFHYACVPLNRKGGVLISNYLFVLAVYVITVFKCCK